MAGDRTAIICKFCRLHGKETEKSFFYEKRKDANENLIKRKAAIGQVLGFTPLVLLIGGYLVAPLLVVSMLQMVNYFNQMTF